MGKQDVKKEAKPKREAKPKKEKAPKAEGEKTKKKKDPNAPKRAQNAYMFYAAAVRDEVRKENPELKMTEIGKIIGNKWKELDEEGKKPYVEQAAKDKERAEKERAAYQASGKAPAKEKPAKKPAKKKAAESEDEEEDEAEAIEEDEEVEEEVDEDDDDE